MTTDILTRRAALLSIGAFAAAGLSACNTTPTAGVPGTAPPPGLRIGAVNIDDAALVAYVGNPTASMGATGAARRTRPGVRGAHGPERPRCGAAQHQPQHALSRRRRARRSRPDNRRCDGGRPYDQRAGGFDLYFESHRSGAARAGPAGPSAVAGGRLRLPAETEARGVISPPYQPLPTAFP